MHRQSETAPHQGVRTCINTGHMNFHLFALVSAGLDAEVTGGSAAPKLCMLGMARCRTLSIIDVAVGW